jgi:hypothetical protein
MRPSLMGMDAAGFPTCVHCAERIGSYEPLCWQRPDGTVSTSSLLHVRQDPDFGVPGSVLYHRDCFGDAQPTSPLSSA